MVALGPLGLRYQRLHVFPHGEFCRSGGLGSARQGRHRSGFASLARYDYFSSHSGRQDSQTSFVVTSPSRLQSDWLGSDLYVTLPVCFCRAAFEARKNGLQIGVAKEPKVFFGSALNVSFVLWVLPSAEHPARLSRLGARSAKVRPRVWPLCGAESKAPFAAGTTLAIHEYPCTSCVSPFQLRDRARRRRYASRLCDVSILRRKACATVVGHSRPHTVPHTAPDCDRFCAGPPWMRRT